MTKERIPGEHDLTTAVPTQPGAVGGTGFGGDLPANDVDMSLDDEERQRSRWEGGGRTPRTAGNKKSDEKNGSTE